MNGTIDLYLGTGNFDESSFYAEELAMEQLTFAVPPQSPINKGIESYQVSDHDIKTDSAASYDTCRFIHL